MKHLVSLFFLVFTASANALEYDIPTLKSMIAQSEDLRVTMKLNWVDFKKIRTVHSTPMRVEWGDAVSYEFVVLDGTTTSRNENVISYAIVKVTHGPSGERRKVVDLDLRSYPETAVTLMPADLLRVVDRSKALLDAERELNEINHEDWGRHSISVDAVIDNLPITLTTPDGRVGSETSLTALDCTFIGMNFTNKALCIAVIDNRTNVYRFF